MARTPYLQVRDSIQTGDKVLFSGESDFSQQIKTFTQCEWSHVGMFIRENGKIKLWESCDKGVDLVEDFDATLKPAKSSIRAYRGTEGNIAIRRLILPPGFDRAEMELRLMVFVHEVKGRPYEENQIELARALFGDRFLLGNRAEALKSFFCSELIAETDQRMGLLPEHRHSNTYRPVDYSAAGVLPYMCGARLGPEILLAERCL